ncbi:MAG: ABC transporter ATP-binding protein [Anaerolineae bacterium]
MPPVVKVDNLRKRYQALTAVDGVSFEVQEGEIFGMVGPNGAGKTTTIECLEGLRVPDSGTISVLGLDPQRDGDALHSRCGTQLQQSNLPDRIRVWEALDLYSSFYRHPLDWRTLLASLGLEEKRNAFFGKLSGGQKQRLFIALALISDPQLIFLDELTTGLDPQARLATWDLVRSVRDSGKTILLTTHFMEEAERLCDRVAILDHGRIIALDTPEALVRSLGFGERVIFTVDGVLPPDLARQLAEAGEVTVDGERITVQSRGEAAEQLVTTVVNLFSAAHLRCSNLRTEQPGMEDVFLNLTGRQMRE